MTTQSFSLDVVRGWAMAFPVLLAWVAGIVIALAKWNRHPKVATLVMAACGLGIFARIIMPLILQISARTIPAPATLMVVNFTWNCVSAVCVGLLLWAAFIDREDAGVKGAE